MESRLVRNARNEHCEQRNGRETEREASSLAFVLQQLAIKSNAVLNSSPVRAIRQWNEIRALLAKHRLSIQCVFEIRSKWFALKWSNTWGLCLQCIWQKYKFTFQLSRPLPWPDKRRKSKSEPRIPAQRWHTHFYCSIGIGIDSSSVKSYVYPKHGRLFWKHWTRCVIINGSARSYAKLGIRNRCYIARNRCDGWVDIANHVHNFIAMLKVKFCVGNFRQSTTVLTLFPA